MTPSTTNTAERELPSNDHLRLHLGEMTAQEMRTAKAAYRLALTDTLTQQQANTSKQAAGEAQSEDMIDPVKIEISIPGELGKTIRFVERKWLYGNDQHHDDAPAMSDSEEAAYLAKRGFYDGPSTLSADIASLTTPPRHPADEGMADALRIAEAALADIGDADREPGDDVAWCERRAAQALPAVRAAIKAGTP